MPENPAVKIWYLKKSLLFAGLSYSDMNALAGMTTMKDFRRKEIIYLPGQPGENVYLLKKGVVKISRITGDGRELTLALLRPGEIFGELEALTEGASATQAEAHSDVLICVLSREKLVAMMQSRPELGIRLSKLIGLRRRVIENRLENLVFRDIPQRLALLLGELTEQFGESRPEGVRISIPLTHEDIANLIGASRATVTEALSDMKRQGLIGNEGKFLLIPDPDRLRQTAS